MSILTCDMSNVRTNRVIISQEITQSAPPAPTRQLDPEKIAQAAQAALRIIRDDPSIIVTVRKVGDDEITTDTGISR